MAYTVTGREPSNLPEVSLLTSWTAAATRSYVRAGTPTPPATGPLGLTYALHEGVQLFDLYFLGHSDLPWYVQAARPHFAIADGAPYSPSEFASDLSVTEIKRIADMLRELVAQQYRGKLVGRRPRFCAAASFFSLISSDDVRQRSEAVRAVRNTVYLAALLGMKCVEIVGGTAIPEIDATDTTDPTAYRNARMNDLAASIRDVYARTLDELSYNGFGTNELAIMSELFNCQDRNLPYLAVEIEPGPSFLINSLKSFKELRDSVYSNRDDDRGDTRAAGKLCLNVDIAHAFLTGYGPSDVEGEGLTPYVGHIHLSDHGGDHLTGSMHAADLRPGTYHFYDYYAGSKNAGGHAFKEWLELAIKLKRNPKIYNRFSGAIGIELESCHDINEVRAAIGITRQWLRDTCGDQAEPVARRNTKGDALNVTCAMMNIDLGNSTHLYSKKPHLLEQFIRASCQIVLDKGGSVVSYTGDGFIAIFESDHFIEDRIAAENAYVAASMICWYIEAVRQKDSPDLSIRASLHWGQTRIPTSGALSDQVMGEDVICTTRLCDFLGHRVEPAQPKNSRGRLLAATKGFKDRLPPNVPENDHWLLWGDPEFKGLRETLIYTVDVDSLPGRHAAAEYGT